jgi:hypothetical protein
MFGEHGTSCPSLRSLFLILRTSAVQGHFAHPYGREWMNIADTVTPLLAELVGE